MFYRISLKGKNIFYVKDLTDQMFELGYRIECEYPKYVPPDEILRAIDFFQDAKYSEYVTKGTFMPETHETDVQHNYAIHAAARAEGII